MHERVNLIKSWSIEARSPWRRRAECVPTSLISRVQQHLVSGTGMK